MNPSFGKFTNDRIALSCRGGLTKQTRHSGDGIWCPLCLVNGKRTWLTLNKVSRSETKTVEEFRKCPLHNHKREKRTHRRNAC